MQKSGVITKLEIQKRDKERVNVYLDNEFSFSLNLLDAAKLHKGQELSQTEVDMLRGEDDVIKAVNSALRFLAYRPRSIDEVRRNLNEKNTVPEVVDMAIDKLSQMGYLDDLAFARYWVENRNMFKPLSPQGLRYELRQKGVADAVIREALADLDAADSAYRAAQGRAQRLRGSSQNDFRGKIGSFLQRRGFSYDTANDVMTRLIEEMETQDSEFFRPDED